MNERIAKLHNQCIVRETRGTTAFNSYVVDRFDSDKFAELIVQECINALWTEECRTNAMTHADYERSGNRIHKHFWG